MLVVWVISMTIMVIVSIIVVWDNVLAIVLPKLWSVRIRGIIVQVDIPIIIERVGIITDSTMGMVASLSLSLSLEL